ncbi:CBM96 family carbohydrate-binding protein [Actinokineospora sp. 24-640]
MAVALVVAATGVVAVAAPAQAEQQPSYATVAPAAWATTDSRRPTETITTGDAVVGSWVDARDKKHTAKSYFTFDLTQFAGKRVVGASIVGVETHVNNCAKPRSTELWVTNQTSNPTWTNQPGETTKVPGGVGHGCKWDYVEWDAEQAVRQAVEGGKLTVALRIAEQHQADPSYGRRYSNELQLLVQYNTAPGTPTELTVSGKPCGDVPLWVSRSWDGTRLTASVADPDESGNPDVRFAWWPRDAPDQRTEVVATAYDGSPAGMSLPDGLTDGRTYAFAARGEDGMDTSAWSTTCLFTTDYTRPGPPAVASEDFPAVTDPAKGHQGVPGELTFTAAGGTDVVAYSWGDGFGEETVPAESPGGPATVTYTPEDYGRHRLVVYAVDRAGNHSEPTYYEFYVHETEPHISTEYHPEVGSPVDVVLSARQPAAVTFTYTVGGGPETTVPVDPSGPTTVTLPSIAFPGPEIRAWTTNAAGQRSGVSSTQVHVNGVAPEIEVTPRTQVAGLPVELSARATQTGAVTLTYWLRGGPRTTVPLGSDGTLHTTFTTGLTGPLTVYATTTNAAGVESAPAQDYFSSDSGTPTVTSTDYPQHQEAGGPGIPGSFTFTSPRPGVTAFRYALGDEEQEVAAVDGTATVRITPMSPAPYYVRVWGVGAEGLITGEKLYYITVRPWRPEVSSPQFPPGGAPAVGPGEQFEIVVTPTLPGSTEAVLRFDWDNQVVVPVGPDGKARHTHTQGQWGTSVPITTRTATGATSGEAHGYFPVD